MRKLPLTDPTADEPDGSAGQRVPAGLHTFFRPPSHRWRAWSNLVFGMLGFLLAYRALGLDLPRGAAPLLGLLGLGGLLEGLAEFVPPQRLVLAALLRIAGWLCWVAFFIVLVVLLF